MHYGGSYYQPLNLFGNMTDTTLLSLIVYWAVSIAVFIMPIIMSCKFQCKKRKLIIILNIALSLFWCLFKLPVAAIVTFIMIAIDKKKSCFYEDEGKRIVWLQIVLYACSVLALFLPIIKLNDNIDGQINFNLISFIENKENLISNQNSYILIMILTIMIISILGLILNLIFRDARKLIGINALFQLTNISMVSSSALLFDNKGLTFPGVALVLESIITIIFVFSICVTIYKTSYIDN